MNAWKRSVLLCADGIRARIYQQVINKLKHINFARVLAAAAAIVIFLTGCSASGFSVENYMRPPAAAGDSAAIQQLLNEVLGTEFSLRYPRSGEYRSAVVLEDIDSDTADEAIVFYRLSTESSGAHMIVLDCDERGEWTIAGQSAGSGEIDRVLFGDINGDGSQEIITGWSGYYDGGTISVHSLVGGVLHRISVVTGEQDAYPADQYSEMAVGDFDGDMRDEVMTVYRSPSDGMAVARILRIGYGVDGSAQMRTADSAATDGSVYQYINAQAGYTGMGSFCMVLDGCRGADQYVTEIVYWDKEEQALVSPLNNTEETVTAVFGRTLPTISQDINGDGMIEIPSDKLLPGYSARSEAPMYLTSWYNFNRDEARLAAQAVMRLDQGYYFRFPIGWDGKVTVQPDADSAIMYFYLTGSGGAFANEIFRVRIFTLDEWGNRRETLADALLQTGDEAPEYQMLAETDYYVYAVMMMPQAEEMGITAEIVSQCFHLTS